MNNYIHIVLLCWSFITMAFPASPIVTLSNFKQLTDPLTDPQYYGNVSMPAWSRSDTYVGASFHDPVSERRYVLIFDIENNLNLKYNTSMKGTRGMQPTRSTSLNRLRRSGKIPNDTHRIQWSPLEESTFFVISRVNNTDYLYRSQIQRTNTGLSIVETSEFSSQVIGVQSQKGITTPVINFTLSNPIRNRFYILYHIGDEEKIHLSINEISKLNNIQKVLIKNEMVIYDAQCIRVDIRKVHIVYQAKIGGSQSDIFSLDTPNIMEDAKNIVNLTNTNDRNERNPRFNPSGNKIAFLRSNKTVSESNKKDQATGYSLIIYDFTNQSETTIFPNVRVVPDVFQQNPFTWLTDEDILFVENNFKKKFPLRVVNINTRESTIVPSPFINHKDVTLSNSKTRLAFVAKGKNDSGDLAFDKLFICDLTIR